MKSYSLFDFDESKANGSTSRNSESFNEELLNYTLNEIEYISKNIETFKQNDEEIFDDIYRRSRLISGLLRINCYHDVNYLLELLVFCTDFLRHNLKNKSVKRIPHEINYIINLITNSAVIMINEKIDGRDSEIVFSDILDECRNYLQDIISLVERETAKAETTGYTKRGGQKNIPALSIESLAPNAMLDEEETVSIPHEKIGFISDYCEEAREILGNIELQLIELEGVENPLPVINQIYKGFTNLKDSANSANIMKIETLAHANQAVLHKIRDGSVLMESEIIDILLYSKKTFEKMINDIASRRPITTPISHAVERCIDFLKNKNLKQNSQDKNVELENNEIEESFDFELEEDE